MAKKGRLANARSVPYMRGNECNWLAPRRGIFRREGSKMKKLGVSLLCSWTLLALSQVGAVRWLVGGGSGGGCHVEPRKHVSNGKERESLASLVKLRHARSERIALLRATRRASIFRDCHVKRDGSVWGLTG